MQKMASGLVFATVGTTKFDSFVSALTRPDALKALKKKGCVNLLIQIGNGQVIPDCKAAEKLGVNITYYRFKSSIVEDIAQAGLIISHAGAGTCLDVLDQRKPLIVVVNDDLMDNHQTELADQLASDGHLYACTVSTLCQTIESVNLRELKPLSKVNPDTFSKYLDKYMGFYEKEECEENG